MIINEKNTQQNPSGNAAEMFRPIDLPVRHDRTTGSAWFLIFVLSLLLHGALTLIIWVARPFSPQNLEISTPEPIQLVFAEQIDPPSNEPRTFSELPEDRNDERPENPDFLSNVTSKARDDVAGGVSGEMPHLRGESEAPHIRMDPDVPGTISEPRSRYEKSSDTAEKNPASKRSPTDQFAEESRESSRIPSLGYELKKIEEMKGKTRESEAAASKIQEERTSQESHVSPVESMSRKSTPSLSGTADLYQEAMEFRTGNTALSGIVSMNTTRWAYAPWLQRFRRNLMRSWLAPVAYYMGIVHGYTTVELDIAPDGTLNSLKTIEEEGHVSLHETSTSLFKVLAPYHPLPADFPEKSLILRIKLIYPPRR